jgi:hypothetical protein
MKERRRAIHADLVRESKDNPGYYRYNITIKEKDGTVHDVPAYGKDLEDAIERLVWNVRIEKVASKKGIMPVFALLLLGVVALSGMIGVIQNNPLWIVGGLGLCGATLFITSAVDNYLNKN